MENSMPIEHSSSWATAALAPWCDFLKRHVSVALKPSDHHGLLIYMRLRPQSSGLLPDQQIVQCREAIALLGAVATVDNAAWQELLEHQCACANLPLVTPGVLPPRFEVRLGDSKDDALGFDTNFYRTFFFVSSAASCGSEEFTEAMQVIRTRATMKEARRGGGLRFSSTIGKCMVHVQFIPRRTLEPELVSGYLTSVLELVRGVQKKRYHNQSEAATTAASTVDTSQEHVSQFVLENVSLHIGRLALPAGASVILAQIVELKDDQIGGGVQLYPWIDIGANTAVGQLPASKMAHLLQVMTSKRLSSSGNYVTSSNEGRVLVAHSEDPGNQNRVHINNFYQHVSKSSSRTYIQKIQALCSAIATSQRIYELHVDSLGFGAMKKRKLECWRWLAYALFSKDSASSVSKLIIEDNYFRERDIEAIMGILRSKNPAATLWSSRTQVDNQDGEDGDSEEELGDDDEEDGHEEVDEHQIFGARMLNGIDEEYGELDFRDSGSEDGGEEEDFEDASKEEEHLEDDQGEQDPVSVCLKAGAVLQICALSKQEIEPITLSLSHKGVRFRMLNNDESCEHVDIIVPYYGHCRVQRESITQFVTASSHSSSSSSSLSLGYKGAITSLSLDFQRPTDGNVLLPLIKYLGPQLTALDMRSEVGVNSSCFRQILNACSNLKTLEIPDIISIAEQELIAAYEARQCKISDLCIFDFAPSENTTKLIRLLCDATSAAAQTLRHLKLIPEPVRAFEATTLSAVLEMLQVNQVLESLQLRIPSALYATFAPELMKFHGQNLPVVRAPLPLSSRFAFLSVVYTTSVSTVGKSDSEDPQPTRKKPRLAAREVELQSLDSDVILLIFLFAAERPTREIDIQSL